MTSMIENLKKVSLSLSNFHGKGLPPGTEPIAFSFIYGAAREGLCPLEVALGEKCVGESVQLTIAADDLPKLCGHLLKPVKKSLNLQILPSQLNLNFTVIDVRDADAREIVTAIAGAIGGSCGGDCSSGCC